MTVPGLAFPHPSASCLLIFTLHNASGHSKPPASLTHTSGLTRLNVGGAASQAFPISSSA